MSKKLVEVRDAFSKVLNDPENLNASSREIASDFHDNKLISFAQASRREVSIIGLIHMMDGLRRRRRPPSDSAIESPDLFASYRLDPIVVVRVSEPGRPTVERNKDLGSLTLPEAMDYLAQHSKERATNTKKARSMRKLIARVKPFMTEGMTLLEGMKLALTADTKKKKHDE